jgi:hypothetical protein
VIAKLRAIGGLQIENEMAQSLPLASVLGAIGGLL